MSNVLRGLTIDIGGSEARGLALGNKIPDGLMTFPNDFVSINEADFRVKDSENPMELCQIISAPRKEYLGIVATGMTGKNYKRTPIGLTNQQKKTSMVDYYKQTLFVIAADAMRNTTSGYDGSQKRFPFSKDNDITEYVVVTCIPVKEHSGINNCSQVLKEALEGTYTVKFPLMDEAENTVQFKLSARNIGVVPEGAVCITALNGELEDDTVTIIIDCGHVTTDLALFVGKQMFGETIISSRFAGGTLISNVKNRLVDEGYVVSDTQVCAAMETGVIKRNTVEVDVSHIIREQKRQFVENYLQSDILNLLNSSQYHAQQVQNIVPIGAPMNDYDGLGSIADNITTVCGMRDATVVKLADDLRYVNITQASMFTAAMCKRAIKELPLEE